MFSMSRRQPSSNPPLRLAAPRSGAASGKQGYPAKLKRSGVGSSFRIIGIDPGIERTGYGVIERRHGVTACLTYGCITTARSQPTPERLYVLFREVRELIAAYRPALVAVETLLFGKNAKTGIVVGEARGVILLAIAEARRPLLEVTPLQVKQALTAYGRAEKSQVQYMVRQVLKLNEIPKPDDAADALAVALAAEQSYVFLQRR